MDVDVSTSVAGNKPQRIRRIQTVTLVLLFMAGIVNFLDRSSLSVAGEAIRGELGFRRQSLVFCFLHFLCLMVFHNYLPVFC
ncbi:hypothetical protein ECO707_22580 [Escherichia coli]|nr:hypothetical protein ECO707_22580 [Escherichia coli]CAK5468651.1 hypothetical protein ECOL707_23300 [Escherichia coli]